MTDNLNECIVTRLDTLDALYFFAQSVEPNSARLTWIRRSFSSAPQDLRARVAAELEAEIAWLRIELGAIATDDELRGLHAEAVSRAQQGNVYLPKWYVEAKLFANYERVLPRWPDMKDHAFVILDSATGRKTNAVFELEGALFRDVQFLLAICRESAATAPDFRARPAEQQHRLHSSLRSVTTVVFHFLEAYLNGLGFDCIHRHCQGLSADEKELLAEWDSKRNAIRYVSFEKKLFRYPVIVGRAEGIAIDMSGCRPAHYIAGEGKKRRDALTHPSPYPDPASGTLEKFQLLATLSLGTVEDIVSAAKDYVLFVEEHLKRDVRETAPWLFERTVAPAESVDSSKAKTE